MSFYSQSSTSTELDIPDSCLFSAYLFSDHVFPLDMFAVAHAVSSLTLFIVLLLTGEQIQLHFTSAWSL